MMKKKLLFQLLFVANVFFATSCSDDDSVELEDVTTLNMLNEDNGKTYLGNSDIYITDENNFSGSSCLLVELGGANGIGKVVPPRVGDGLVRKAAVLPAVNVGAVVKYAPVYPDPQGLPEYGSVIGEVSNSGDVVEMDFPKDVEFLYSTSNGFEITTDGGKLTVTYYYWTDSKEYSIYVRRGSIFTEVIIQVV